MHLSQTSAFYYIQIDVVIDVNVHVHRVSKPGDIDYVW